MLGVTILLQRSWTSPEGEHDKLALCVRCSSLQGKSKRSINELLRVPGYCRAGERVS